MRAIVAPLYQRFGYEVIEDEPQLNRYARGLAIDLACEYGTASCLIQTAARLREFLQNGVRVAPDIQREVYCHGLRQSDIGTFFMLLGRMLQSEYQGERSLIQEALGCSQDATALTLYLSLAIQPGDALRLHERLNVLVAPVNGGDVGLRVMMDFIRRTFQPILDISPDQVGVMLSAIAERVVTSEMFEEFDSLLTMLVGANVISEGSADNLRATVTSVFEWRELYVEHIERILQDHSRIVY